MHKIVVIFTFYGCYVQISKDFSDSTIYYRGLKEYSNERGVLIEPCYDGQDTFRALLKLFGLRHVLFIGFLGLCEYHLTSQN